MAIESFFDTLTLLSNESPKNYALSASLSCDFYFGAIKVGSDKHSAKFSFKKVILDSSEIIPIATISFVFLAASKSCDY